MLYLIVVESNLKRAAYVSLEIVPRHAILNTETVRLSY